MPLDVVAVDLGHDERDVRLHAERGAVVDQDATGLGDPRAPHARGGGGGGAEDEVGAGEGVLGGLLDGDGLVAVAQLAPGGASSREEAQIADGQVALGGDVEEDGADGAGRADDRDVESVGVAHGSQ